MKNLLVLCVVFSILEVISSQLFFQGSCPIYEAEKNFDLKRYLGKWYEIEKYFNLIEVGGTCITTKLVTQKDGSTTITDSLTRPMSGRRISRTGSIRELNRNNNTSKLAVSFSTVPFMNQEEYQILATDYSNYSIVSSCRTVRVFSFRKLWVLCRERFPSSEIRGQIYANLKKFGINLRFLKQTEQENCPTQHDLPNTF